MEPDFMQLLRIVPVKELSNIRKIPRNHLPPRFKIGKSGQLSLVMITRKISIQPS